MAVRSPDLPLPGDVPSEGTESSIQKQAQRVKLPNPIVGGVKGAGWLGAFGGGRVLDALRFIKKHPKGITTFTAGAVIGATALGAALSPSKTVDVYKAGAMGSANAALDPKRAAGEAVGAIDKAVLAGVDKFRQEVGFDSSTKKEDGDPIEAVVDTYWPGATSADREKIKNNVSVMHAYYVGTEDQPPLLPPETYRNLETSYQLVLNACKDAPWLVNPIIGLWIAESRGGVDRNVVTEAGATGDFMITENFIRDHGHEPTGDEHDPRLDLNITLPIVVEELKSRTEYFGGNVGFAVWSWQRGVHAVEDDLFRYAEQQGWDANVSAAELVRAHNITEYDLEEDSLIQEDLKKPTQNSTVLFLQRNAAGDLVWQHVEMLKGKHPVTVVELPLQEERKAA